MLRWSARARVDLKAIYDHIARDSPVRARNVAREILRRADLLPDTPNVGGVVPELNDQNVREIPIHSWRLVYQIREDGLFILTLVHKRRAPNARHLSG